MARNATLPITPAQVHTAHVALDALVPAMGSTVTLTGTKRSDGTPFTRAGTVVDFLGQADMSNGAVQIETADGLRTFNLWLIRTVHAG